ncbi:MULTISPECIES: hypothetical protein [unclassified Blastococcus]
MGTLSAPPAAAATGFRRVLPSMRVLLGAFAVLTAAAVVALFVLAEQTDRTFAWTIQPPLTAAFLGAGYAAGCVLVLLSLRETVWANVRVPVLTVLVFVLLTLAATLLHLDRFHMNVDAAGAAAVAAAWFWLTVYVVVPVGMVLALWRQERAPGADPPATAPVPVVLRVALAIESVLLTAVGAALFVAPGTATDLWPWPLTPLTARVVAAWLVAFGLATALAAAAGDLRRLRTAAIAYTVFGVLVAVAVARFADTVAWGDPAAWVFAAATVAVVGTGAAGWRLAPADGAGR